MGLELTEKQKAGYLKASDLMEEGVRLILRGMGELGVDVRSEDFRQTPQRVARSFLEFCRGSMDTSRQVQAICSRSFPGNGYDQMLVEREIRCVGLCPHHLLPVRYVVSVGYVPGDNQVIGLSKLARLCELLAARPVLQEQFTQDVAVIMQELVHATGVGVVVVGKHTCMTDRGVRKPDAEVVTSKLLGVMLDNSTARSEFLQLVRS